MLKVLLSVAQILAKCFVARRSTLHLKLSSRLVLGITAVNLYFYSTLKSNQRNIRCIRVMDSNQTLHLHILKCTVYKIQN